MIKVNFYNKLYGVELTSPDSLKAKINEEDTEYSFFELSSSVKKFLYGIDGPLGMSFKASEKLYNEVSHELWKEQITEKMERKGFDLNSLLYITISGLVLEVFRGDENIKLEAAKNCYNKFINDIEKIKDMAYEETFDLNNYITKIIYKCSDVTDNEEAFSNIITLELDYRNSNYLLIPGILVDKCLWLNNHPSVDERYISVYLEKLNLADEINLANKFGPALYKDFKYDENLVDNTMSLGELLNTLKHCNIGVEYDKLKTSPNYGSVLALNGIDEGSLIGSDIIDSINSENTPFKALKRLLSLEKSFIDSKISFRRILMFLFQEYFNLNVNISLDEILSIRSKITKYKGDFKIIENGIKKLEK